MIRRPPRSTLSSSSAASDVYKRQTLAYMPSLLSFISQRDFLSHPWYQNAGRSLVYTCPPGSKSNGFGDNSEKGSEPNRLIAAFADYLACETGDSYAGWYAGECRDLLRRDYELRLYRMCTDQDYNTAFPAEADKMVWYKDAGEVAMHLSLIHISEPTRRTPISYAVFCLKKKKEKKGKKKKSIQLSHLGVPTQQRYVL